MENKSMNTENISLQNQIKKLKKIENKLEINHKKMQIDINGKKKEINQKNNLLERIFSNTHILIAYFDRNFNFIQVNASYAKYNKKTIRYFTGKNYFDLYPYEKNSDIFEKVVETGKPYIVFEKYFNHNINIEKNDLYWDWSLHPVKDKTGKVNGVILTLLDVTQRVKDRMELEKTKDKLHQSKRLSDLGLLAATVAHELRNPLSVIQAALYNIDRKKENIPIESQIKTIEKKIIESEQIISNLLSYAKIKMPNLEKVNILQFIDESIDAVKISFTNDDIKIVKDISADFNNFINVDSHQIKEVFTNLILNAFQSMDKKKGLIHIAAKNDNESMEIVIADNGSGIKKSDLVKVFEPFFTRKTKGTGLGLSLCREIINLHNGSIAIESKLTKGTSIFIKLPYQEKS
jgi:signal transduction histidine kinase